MSRLQFSLVVWPLFVQPLARDLSSSSSLLVIDVQNDFIDGSLGLVNAPAGQDGREVIQPINDALLPLFPAGGSVVYSLDWHPKDHVSFLSNLDHRTWTSSSLSPPAAPKGDASDAVQLFDVVTFSKPPPAFNQTLFPDHCVQGTWGAQLHSELKVSKNRKTEGK